MKKALRFIASALFFLVVAFIFFAGPGPLHAQQWGGTSVSESARIQREKEEALQRQEQERREFMARPDRTVSEWTRLQSRHIAEIEAFDHRLEAARFTESIAHLSRAEQWAAIDRRDYEQYLRDLRRGNGTREWGQISQQYREREAAKQRQRAALLEQEALANRSAEEQERLRAEAEQRMRDQQTANQDSGGGGSEASDAAAVAATLASMAAAKAASEAMTEGAAGMIGRGGDPFVFCHEGPDGGVASNGWTPISPSAGAYTIQWYCSGVPCPNWQYIPAYTSLCPQGRGVGKWEGPGGPGATGQYQSSGGSQYKANPENPGNEGLLPFMH